MTEDLEALKKELTEERERRVKLESQLEDKEKKFTEQYQRLLQVEQGIITGEEALRTIEKDHIDTLSRHLRKEHKARTEVEETLYKERAGFEQKLRKEKEKSAALEEKVKQLSENADSSEDMSVKMAKATEISGLASDMNLGLEDPLDSFAVETQDFLKLISRIGKVSVSEAARTLDIDRRKVLKCAKELRKKGFVTIETTKNKDQLVSSTKDLVKKMSDMKISMRKKGRFVK